MDDLNMALRYQQGAALHLYRAVRGLPGERERRMLAVCAELLREVTHVAKRVRPPSVICMVDGDGRVVRMG